MIRIVLAAALSLLAAEASAINRYQTTSMSCAKIKAILNNEGAAILRWQSTRNPGLPLYGRFVKSRQYLRSKRSHGVCKRARRRHQILLGPQMRPHRLHFDPVGRHLTFSPCGRRWPTRSAAEGRSDEGCWPNAIDGAK